MSLFAEKHQTILLRRSPKIIFITILRRNFSKNSNFENSELLNCKMFQDNGRNKNASTNNKQLNLELLSHLSIGQTDTYTDYRYWYLFGENIGIGILIDPLPV